MSGSRPYIPSGGLGIAAVLWQYACRYVPPCSGSHYTSCRLCALYNLFLLLLLPHGLQAQRYSFAQYEVEDGLVQSSVNHLTQDHFGNLWIATAGGVSRFDGDTFTNFHVQDGLAGSNVLFLYEDRQQRILMGSSMGLTVYDGNTFRNFQARDKDGNLMAVRQIWEDPQGNIRLLLELSEMATFTGDTIHYTDDDRDFNALLSGQYITGLKQDASGKLWLCTYQGGLYAWDYQHLTSWLEGAENNQYHYTDLYLEESGTVWLLDFRQVLTFDTAQQKLERLELQMPPFERTYVLSKDLQGKFWVGTTNGTFSFDPVSRQTDMKSMGLSGSVVRSVFRDREGNMWFGSFGDGIYKFKGRLFTRLRTEEGLSVKTIMTITRDRQGHLWLGSYGSGVDRYSQGEIRHFGISEGISSEFVSSIVEDSTGNLWFGTWYGLNRFDGEKFTLYTADNGLPASICYSGLRDSRNRLWFGTMKGLVSYEDGKFMPVYDENNVLFDREVTSLLEVEEGKLVLVAHDEVFVWEQGKVRPLLGAELFQNEMITSIVPDGQRHLLLATINGLIYRYDFEQGTLQLLNQLHQIPQFMIYSMIFADDGSLLVGTQRGIFRFFFDADGKITSHRQYGKNEGFLGVEANANAVYREADGSIWFGTVDGAYKFIPEEDQLLSDTVHTHLTGIKLYYEDVDWKQFTAEVSPWYDIPRQLLLNHKQNHLVFTYKGISLTNPEGVRYRFMLENLDESWSPVTDRTEAVYVNIPPGTYTFRVKARNPYGLWSETPATFTFEILPPFWQTWWFYVLAILLLSLAIRLFFLWNLRQERQRRQELEAEVACRTSEIKALNDSLELRVQQRTSELELSNRKFEVEFNLRKLDQDRLARQEKEYRMLVNNLREVIFRTDSQGNFTFLNYRWQEYTGYTMQESLGTHFTVYLHTDDRRVHQYELYALVRNRLPHFEMELRIKRRNGTTFWGKISARPEYDEEGNPIGSYGSLVDIDQRKRAEFALRGSEEKYKFLTENTQDIITLQAPDLRYSYVSPRIREVAGLNPEDLLGKMPVEFLHPEDMDTYLQFHREVKEDRMIKGKILRFRNGQGEYRWYETFLKPILDENGELKSFISSSRDVTEKIVLSKEIEKVRKKVAQDFHDEMGNNLASISVLSQIIQNKLGSQQNGIEALLTKIDTASKNLFHGTRDFIWAIDPKNDNLYEVYLNLKDFGEDLFDHTGISFYASYELQEEDYLRLPSGWSRQIVLIFKEALTNALKYSRASLVRMQFVQQLGCFHISLEDDGVGFALASDGGQHRGLQHMKERAAKLDACLTIQAEAGKGVGICLQGKITQNGVLKY